MGMTIIEKILARKAGLESVSVGEFLHSVRALRDPEILSVSASSAALCEAGLVH